MSQINVNIDDDLERKFRLKIFEVLGGKRGSLKIALEESIQLWINKYSEEQKQLE